MRIPFVDLKAGYTSNRYSIDRAITDVITKTAIHNPIILPNLTVYKYPACGHAPFPISAQFRTGILLFPKYREFGEEDIVFISGTAGIFL